MAVYFKNIFQKLLTWKSQCSTNNPNLASVFSLSLVFCLMTNDQLQFQLEMSSNIHFNDDIKKIMIIVTKIKKTKQSKSKLAKIL